MSDQPTIHILLQHNNLLNFPARIDRDTLPRLSREIKVSETLDRMTSILTLPSHMTGFLHELGTQSGIYRLVQYIFSPVSAVTVDV